MNCILLKADGLCNKDCNGCFIIGPFKKDRIYKLGNLNGTYDICCPFCGRYKNGVLAEEIVQGNCAECLKERRAK